MAKYNLAGMSDITSVIVYSHEDQNVIVICRDTSIPTNYRCSPLDAVGNAGTGYMDSASHDFVEWVCDKQCN